MILDEISDISIGLVLKRKQSVYKSSKSKKYKLFNVRNYEDGALYEDFYSDEDLSNFLTKEGDIIFRLAMPLRAIEVTKEISGTIITNQFCLIRLKSKRYTSSFLSWYLQSDLMRKQIEKYLMGTAIRAVPISKVKTIQVPEISIEKQKKLSNIIKNWNKQEELLKQEINLKNKYFYSIIRNEIKKEIK